MFSLSDIAATAIGGAITEIEKFKSRGCYFVHSVLRIQRETEKGWKKLNITERGNEMEKLIAN